MKFISEATSMNFKKKIKINKKENRCKSNNEDETANY